MLHKFKPQENILFQKDSSVHIGNPRASRVTRTRNREIVRTSLESAGHGELLQTGSQGMFTSGRLPDWLDQLPLSRAWKK